MRQSEHMRPPVEAVECEREPLFFAVLLAYRKARPARGQPARMSRYCGVRIGRLATGC